MTPIAGIGAECVLDRGDVAERHAHRVVDQLELAAVERAVGDRQHALGLAVEGILRIDDFRPLRPGGALGDLDRGFHRLRARRAQEHHVELARRAGGDVIGECRRILRHEGDGDLVALLFLESAARLEDARMVVAERQRAEAAEEVEDLAAVLVDVEHALGTLDLDLVEAEQLHEMQLAGIDVRLEQVGHARDVERLGVLDATAASAWVCRPAPAAALQRRCGPRPYRALS